MKNTIIILAFEIIFTLISCAYLYSFYKNRNLYSEIILNKSSIHGLMVGLTEKGALKDDLIMVSPNELLDKSEIAITESWVNHPQSVSTEETKRMKILKTQKLERLLKDEYIKLTIKF